MYGAHKSPHSNYVNIIIHSGAKCGSPRQRSTFDRYLRIVGGSQARYGSHPWLACTFQPNAV